MSDIFVQPSPPGSRIAGRWQIPAFLLAGVLLTVVVLQVKSPTAKVSVDEHRRQIALLMDKGVYVPALELISKLMTHPELDSAARTELHLLTAQATDRQARRIRDDTATTARQVVDLYEKAREAGAELLAEDLQSIAERYARVGVAEAALRYFHLAVEKLPAPALDCRRRIIELNEYPLQVDDAEIERMLQEFTGLAADAPDHLLWGVSRLVELQAADGRIGEAEALWKAHAAGFAEGPGAAAFQYLKYLLWWHAERYDECELGLRDLLNELALSDPVYPRAAWLLGRVVLYDGRAQRPEEALAIFREVVAARGDGAYVAAACLGMAESLAELQRWAESLAAYRAAVAELAHVPGTALVNRHVVMVSASAVAARLGQAGQRVMALEFARLAAELVGYGGREEQARVIALLGQLAAGAARELAAGARGRHSAESPTADDEASAERAAELFAEAGDVYLRLAALHTMQPEQSAEALWTAAAVYEEGGHRASAITALRSFVAAHPDSEMTPRVLLRLGRALQAVGNYGEAVEVLQSDFSRYPRSPYANEALLPLAECLMALGDEHAGRAEEALRQIVDNSEIYTPDAPEYRDAMFLLGRLYARSHKWEQALVVLAEVVEQYGRDGRALRARFLRADAFRQSALEIRAELDAPENVGDKERLQAEVVQRLESAARDYRDLIERAEAAEAHLSPVERIYLQDARLYEADCYFQLGRHAEALALYERAAWIHKDSAAALGAYVQVVNCYAYLGRDRDALAALRRAQYLVDSLPEEAFAGRIGLESRADWKAYFEWMNTVLADSEGTAGLAKGSSPDTQ